MAGLCRLCCFLYRLTLGLAAGQDHGRRYRLERQLYYPTLLGFLRPNPPERNAACRPLHFYRINRLCLGLSDYLGSEIHRHYALHRLFHFFRFFYCLELSLVYLLGFPQTILKDRNRFFAYLQKQHPSAVWPLEKDRDHRDRAYA